MEKKDYIVLSDGKEVAGIRSPGKGKKISLTAEEARHPLRIGHIKPATASVKAPSAAKEK